MAKLTDVSIRNLKAGAARREIPDDGARGLYLIMQPSGRKSFAVRYRHNGLTRKLTLQPGISLAAARKFTAAAMHEVAEGRDPAAAKKQAKERAANTARDALRSVCAQYFQHKVAKELRTAYERERIITRLVYTSPLASRPIDAITRRDLIGLLDLIEENNGKRSADMVLSIMRRIFRWHALRSDTFNSPIVPGMARYEYAKHARERTLTDDELRAVWRVTGEIGVYGAMLKFLLLTTARLREAARVTWDEIGADDTWNLPASRSKTGKALVRPLSRATLNLLATLPRLNDCPFVFSLDGKHAFSGFSRWKKKLDDACGVKNWCVHDLRRTARSLLSRAGVNSDHAERVLGHVIGGIRATYDRHAWYNEKKQALEALATQIHRIVDPQPNVVALRG
jgi:integrase